MSDARETAPPPRLPFDTEYQKALLRLLCEDDGFAHVVIEYLEPHYFENEVLKWAFAYCQRHREQYGTMPALGVLKQQTNGMDPRLRPVYAAFIEQVQEAPMRDEQWMRDAVVDFVKRSIFVQTYGETRQLYNTGKVEEAYDLMMERMERIMKTGWEPVDRAFYFEELPARHSRRLREDPSANAVTTGLSWLDNILVGGLSLGELGIWIAYAKGGKSAKLVNHGIAAARGQMREVLHIVLEGSRQQVENRYDAAFMDELYHVVKAGGLSAEKYSRTYQEFQFLQRKLVLRGFLEHWEYSVLDIVDELDALKRQYGWKPSLIIVDYGDLLGGRKKSYRTETDKQKAVFRDLKKIAERGYAVWTASQAQRPDKGAEDKAHYIYARQIADCYEKVRVADFIGSINATQAEKDEKMARLFAELYRDNEAGQSLLVRADFTKMTIKEEPGLVSPSMPEAQASVALGHVQHRASV